MKHYAGFIVGMVMVLAGFCNITVLAQELPLKERPEAAFGEYSESMDESDYSEDNPELVMAGNDGSSLGEITHTTFAGHDAICVDHSKYYISGGITSGNYEKDQMRFSSNGPVLHIEGCLEDMPHFQSYQNVPCCNSTRTYVSVGIWQRKLASDEPAVWERFSYDNMTVCMDVDCSSLDGIYGVLLYFNSKCACIEREICVVDGEIYFGDDYGGYSEDYYANYIEFTNKLSRLEPQTVLDEYLSGDDSLLVDYNMNLAADITQGCENNYAKALAIYKYFEDYGEDYAYDKDVAMAMLGALKIPAINTTRYGVLFYSDEWHTMDVDKIRYSNCHGYFDRSTWDMIGDSWCQCEIRQYTAESKEAAQEETTPEEVIEMQNYTSVERFVIRLYDKCLGRLPDEEGLRSWTAVLDSGESSGAEVAYGFVFSQEYRNKNTSDEDYIEMLYNVFLDRSSDETGKDSWLYVLSCGVSREYVFHGFAESQEYTNICQSYGIERGMVSLMQARDKNINVTSYVNRLYTMALGRDGEEAGLNYWCNVILTGESTPEEVAEAFINSEEFQNRNLCCENYIKVLYRTFMNREYDQEGLDNWMAAWRQGYNKQDILHRFAISQEFKNIQASFGL